MLFSGKTIYFVLVCPNFLFDYNFTVYNYWPLFTNKLKYNFYFALNSKWKIFLKYIYFALNTK